VREVYYKRTLEAIASDILEYGTRVLIGVRDEVTTPVETGMIQVGL
jgi:hypothetical protein